MPPRRGGSSPHARRVVGLSSPRLADIGYFTAPKRRVASLEVEQRAQQIVAVEVGPQHIGAVELGVGDLPQQEVRDAQLARRADDQIGIGDVGGVELALEHLLGQFGQLSGAFGCRERRLMAQGVDRVQDLLAQRRSSRRRRASCRCCRASAPRLPRTPRASPRAEATGRRWCARARFSSSRPSTSASIVLANRSISPTTSSAGRFQFSVENE